MRKRVQCCGDTVKQGFQGTRPATHHRQWDSDGPPPQLKKKHEWSLFRYLVVHPPIHQKGSTQRQTGSTYYEPDWIDKIAPVNVRWSSVEHRRKEIALSWPRIGSVPAHHWTRSLWVPTDCASRGGLDLSLAQEARPSRRKTLGFPGIPKIQNLRAADPDRIFYPVINYALPANADGCSCLLDK